MMQRRQEYPKRVNVNAAGADLQRDIQRGVTPTKEESAAPEQDWQEKYLRLAAEMENSKKRLAQTYKRQAEQEKERLLNDFLEVADNLQRALAHTNNESGSLVEGMKTIQRQFQQILMRHEVRPYNPAGQPFDPEWHEAVSVIHHPGLPPNTVAQVVQPGYTIEDRLLRPARVVVAE